MTPWRIALGYTAFSLLALALFATPLWFGWRTNIGTFRTFVADDMQTLVQQFRDQGHAAVADSVRSRLASAPPDSVIVFAGPGKQVLAGTLRAWPPQIPDSPGTYGLAIDIDDTPVRVVASYMTLPGDYHLLIGRESVRFESLVERFWYGMAAALAILLLLGAVIAWQIARRTSMARYSEERYALAMEAAGDGHTDWNLETSAHYISPRLLEICGHPPDAKFRDRADWVRRFPFHPEDRPKWERAIAEHYASRESHFMMELRIVVRGEVRWTAFHFLSTRKADGTPIRWTGSIGDITERKRAEEALRESQERYALAVAGSDDGVWDIDFAAKSVFVSPRAREIVGLPPGPEQVPMDEYFAMLPVHPEDAARRIAAMQAHLDGKAPNYECEFRLRQRDGVYRWCRVHGLCVRDAKGNPHRMAGSVADIDARRRAAEALRSSEEDLRSRQEMLELAQKSARAIAYEWRFGEGAERNRWSPDIEAMYGLAPGTYDGTYTTWRKLIHPDDWPLVRTAMREARRTGDIEAEYRVVHPDGSVHWLQTRGRMFFDAVRRPTRIVGFMQDITQRKQAQDELQKMERELRRAQRLEALGTLAGGIAHDFNNILGAIMGYGEMALRDKGKGARLERDIAAILSAGERGRALVDRILAFSRSGVGERAPVNVEAAVREALDQIAANLPGNVTLAPRLHAGRAAMLGDSTQVHQVVMNLASNAVQSMPQGGTMRIALEVASFDAPRAVTVGAIDIGDYVVLRVSDTGSGIADDVLERMFDPFFTTKEVGVGTGLGLSLVHGIVTSVGGAIEVVTQLGRGSTFSVYLPRSGDAPDQPDDEDEPVPRGDGQRVLVVDDEEPLMLLATETLEDLGYAPVGFTSSTAALAAFRADPARFDALLTDERMPGLSGSALIREVRGIRDGIPVVLMSGYIGLQSVDADIVVRKPLSMRDLAASIARVLNP